MFFPPDFEETIEITLQPDYVFSLRKAPQKILPWSCGGGGRFPTPSPGFV